MAKECQKFAVGLETPNSTGYSGRKHHFQRIFLTILRACSPLTPFNKKPGSIF